MIESTEYADMQMFSYFQFLQIVLCQYFILDLGMYSRSACVTRRRLAARIGGSKQEDVGRFGQTMDEMGKRNGADQSDVSGGVGRGQTCALSGRKREGASRNQSPFARGTNRRDSFKVRYHFVVNMV